MHPLLFTFAKLFAMVGLIRLLFWGIRSAIKAWRNLALVLAFLSLSLTASAQAEPLPLHADQAAHNRAVEIVAFGAFGALLARMFFAAWKR